MKPAHLSDNQLHDDHLHAEHGEDEFYDPEFAGTSNGHPAAVGKDIQIDLPNVDDIEEEPDAF